MGTTAQYDPSLSHLRFEMPSGPLRPLLPSLSDPRNLALSVGGDNVAETTFNDIVLGTALNMLYSVEWPLDMFLQPTDLQIYGTLFSFLSSLRRTHTRMHACWATLSNSQRARRRWTGLGEGGTTEDLAARHALLRCGWGLVREMNWFLDNLLSYVMTDVIDSEFRRLKKQLSPDGESKAQNPETTGGQSAEPSNPKAAEHAEAGIEPAMAPGTSLDFTTLQSIHNTYLERLLTGCLLTNPVLAATLRPIFELCEQLVAQVERWGGDVLPALLFEGSMSGGADEVGKMVRERWSVVSEINEVRIGALPTYLSLMSASSSHIIRRSIHYWTRFMRSSLSPRLSRHSREERTYQSQVSLTVRCTAYRCRHRECDGGTVYGLRRLGRCDDTLNGCYSGWTSMRS
jgi:hypothetical protein